ncbi:hypothetical protein ACUH95_00560 [Dermabacteraceae bacterium P13101]
MTTNDPRAQSEINAAMQAHRESGLLDEVLVDRYAHKGDLVAFIDETHRTTDRGELSYYGLSAVIFHADDLPQVRRDLEEIAEGKTWHAKDMYKISSRRESIERMAAYINEKAAKPIVVFDLKKGDLAQEADERKMRDEVLRSTLKHLNDEGIRDVVLDAFPARLKHNAEADALLLLSMKTDDQVDKAMWMHHARMGEEHALWSADTVAWAIQRSEFGWRENDSRFIAPMTPNLHHAHARTGLNVPPVVRPEAARRANQDRRPPVLDMQARIRQAKEKLEKARRDSAAKRGINTQPPARNLARPIAPPATRREGPTQSR